MPLATIQNIEELRRLRGWRVGGSIARLGASCELRSYRENSGWRPEARSKARTADFEVPS
jgi:hypothetical protein